MRPRRKKPLGHAQGQEEPALTLAALANTYLVGAINGDGGDGRRASGRSHPGGRGTLPPPARLMRRARARVPTRSKMLTAIAATEGDVHDGGDGRRAGGRSRSLPRGRSTLPPPARARARVSDDGGVQLLLTTIAATEDTCTTIGEFYAD
jgi:hypothetical protein